MQYFTYIQGIVCRGCNDRALARRWAAVVTGTPASASLASPCTMADMHVNKEQHVHVPASFDADALCCLQSVRGCDKCTAGGLLLWEVVVSDHKELMRQTIPSTF
jgi:hypothetical protein